MVVRQHISVHAIYPIHAQIHVCVCVSDYPAVDQKQWIAYMRLSSVCGILSDDGTRTTVCIHSFH